MVEQDLHYILGIVVDYCVFEWSTDVITWYVYIFFLAGRGNSTQSLLSTSSLLPVDINQPVKMNDGQYTLNTCRVWLIHNHWTNIWNTFHVMGL